MFRRLNGREPWVHPAKRWYSRLFWHDWSGQDREMQVIDLLHDVRLLLFVIVLTLWFS